MQDMHEMQEGPEITQRKKRSARTTIAMILVAALVLAGSGFAVAWNLRGSRANAAAGGTAIGTVALTKSTASPPTSSLAATVKRVLPSVVNIHATSFSTNPFGQSQTGRSEASGIILSRDGVILTNNHVVAGSSSVTVSFTDGQHDQMPGTVLGTDPKHDLALVKVAATDLSPITVGSSSKLQLGDRVAAIGFPLGLGGPTVTEGIVSGLARDVTVGGEGTTEHLKGLIQTDAAINPGNSGGPLIDGNGNLVGINTAAASASAAENTGFSIAIDGAMPVIEQIMQQKPTQRAWIGVEVQTLTSALAAQLGLPGSASGAAVAGVVPGGPASSSGLRRGDVIQGVGSASVTDASGLTQALAGHSPGDKVVVRVLRPGGVTSIDVTLGQRPLSLVG